MNKFVCSYRHTVVVASGVVCLAVAISSLLSQSFFHVNAAASPIPAVAGVTYHVAVSGSDSNPGTESEPFRTIQRAADVVSAGDLVMVGDGIYTDEDRDGAIVMLRRGGTSSALVTFKSRNKWGAKLDGQNNRAVSGFQFGAVNYIRIEGFEIYGVGNGGSGGASGIEIYSGGHNSEIVGNHIHDVGKMCTDTSNGQNGIFVEQPDVVIERNLIHDIGRYALGENGCSPATSYYQNNDHGIYMDGASNGSSIPGASGTVVKNNIFYNNKRGWSIQVYPGTISRMKIYNNTFAFENPYREGHIIIGSSGSDNEIKNNIFYDPKSSAIYFYTGTQTNMVVSNNLTYNGVTANIVPAGVTFTNNVNNTDPLLMAPLFFDFHLQASSLAVDSGTTLIDAGEDFDGVARPQANGYDIGAYEFTDATPAPSPTPTPIPSPSPSPITNTAPSVFITSPATDLTFRSRSDIVIAAIANDSDGWIAQVEFYLNGTPIGTATSSPYTITWNNAKSGKYTLTAKAIDNLGGSAIAVPVYVTVTVHQR
jgi:hypothetical protein